MAFLFKKLGRGGSGKTQKPKQDSATAAELLGSSAPNGELLSDEAHKEGRPAALLDSGSAEHADLKGGSFARLIRSQAHNPSDSAKFHTPDDFHTSSASDPHHRPQNGHASGPGTSAPTGSAHPGRRDMSKPQGCPLRHGTVYVNPYPGYVHGKHPQICKNGCVPDMEVEKISERQDTLLREAVEYQELIHKEWESTDVVKEARIREILDEIERTGTYTHTFQELEYGARVAWRNAPKCANRKFWDQIKLIDARHVQNAEDMFGCILTHIETANLAGASEPIITVFRPEHPLTGTGGSMVWNTQCIRYAGYRIEGAGGDYGQDVMGDPANLHFTEMLQTCFGYKPPRGEPGYFDVLPLVLQIDLDTPPELFYLPEQYITEIQMDHPKYPWFADLELRWYGIPMVSCLALDCGGIRYTGIPFNGWYAETEVVRDFADECRYNVLPKIAEKMGLPTGKDATMWKDHALAVLAQVVMHSFTEARFSMVDHHTLISQFWDWYHNELKDRGYCPGNWKWIIPPLSASQSKCYLGLNKMTEYTLKPVYAGSYSWRQAAHKWFKEKLEAPEKEHSSEGVEKTEAVVKNQALKVIILYATVTGNCRRLAEEVLLLLAEGQIEVSIVDLEKFNITQTDPIQQANILILLTSTFGSGTPPQSAARFLKWVSLFQSAPTNPLAGKHFAIYGLGASSYPRFCAAADLFYTVMLGAECRPLTTVSKGDFLGAYEHTFMSWMLGWLSEVSQKYPGSAAQLNQISKKTAEILTAQDELKLLFNVIQLKGVKRLATEPGWKPGLVVKVKELLAEELLASGRSTKLVQIGIKGMRNAVYWPGDHLKVKPVNNLGEELDEFAKHLGIEDLDEVFSLEVLDDNAKISEPFPTPITFRRALTEHIAVLSKPSQKTLLNLATFAEGTDVTQLKVLGSRLEDFRDWLRHTGCRWLDIFRTFSSLIGNLPLAAFIQLVPTIHARSYSIASSPWAAKDEVHLVVGKLSYKLPNGQLRKGHCSNFLTDTVKEGDHVRVMFTRVPSFQLPLRGACPIIMIAAGTGLAPHRGFMQHLRILKSREEKLGPATLIFGCRSSKDFILKDMVEECVEEGVLTHLLVAYSREPGQEKMYVQDLIKEKGALLAPYLQEPNCHVYICGDSNMSNSVSSALAKIAGGDRLSRMAGDGRFHEDVFGVTLDTAAKMSEGGKLANARAAMMRLQSLIQLGNLSEIKAMFEEKEANADSVDSQGNTPLHLAAFAGNLEVVQLLVNLGAPVQAINRWGLTPAGVAFCRKHTALVHAIYIKQGRLASSIHKDFYPLHRAAIEGDYDACQSLINDGVDIGSTDFQGTFPLLLAAMFGRLSVVRLLVQAGANVNAFDREGHTALEGALTYSQKDVAQFLKDKGARLTVSDSDLTAAWPSLTTWSPAQAAMDPTFKAKIANAQSGWSFTSGGSFPSKVKGLLEENGLLLFRNLFETSPRLLTLFPFKDENGVPIEKDLRAHGLKVMETLGALVNTLSNVDEALAMLRGLIKKHLRYGVQLQHYDIVGSTLLLTIQQALGSKWGPDEKDAWTAIVQIVTATAAEVYQEEEDQHKEATDPQK